MTARDTLYLPLRESFLDTIRPRQAEKMTPGVFLEIEAGHLILATPDGGLRLRLGSAEDALALAGALLAMGEHLAGHESSVLAAIERLRLVREVPADG